MQNSRKVFVFFMLDYKLFGILNVKLSYLEALVILIMHAIRISFYKSCCLFMEEKYPVMLRSACYATYLRFVVTLSALYNGAKF